MRAKGFDDNTKRQIRSKLYEYAEKQIKNGEDVELNSVSAIANVEKPQDFREFIDEKGLEVSGSFHSNNIKDFTPLVIKKIKGKGYKLEYDIGNENIEIDRQNNRIIIKNISPKKLQD